MTRVCVTGSETSEIELLRRLEDVLSHNSRVLCEIRMDYLRLNPQEALRFLESIPEKFCSRLIITQRLRASGPLARGQCSWDILDWKNWWMQAMQIRQWFAIDLDWIILDQINEIALEWQPQAKSEHILFSFHSELKEIEKFYPQIQHSANKINAGVKLAAPVQGVVDLARLADISGFIHSHPLNILVAMGNAGRAWRWSKLAGDITYFAYNDQSRTAPGQAIWEEVLPYFEQAGVPDLYVLWNQDPENFYGEKQWNRLFQSLGLHARYVALACVPEELNNDWVSFALGWMKRANVRGASVTRPYKECFAVYGGSGARAINTIRLSEANEWEFFDTDGLAVMQIAQEYLEADSPQKAAILGSGGASKALCSYFAKYDFPLDVFQRDLAGNINDLQKLSEYPFFISTWPLEAQEDLKEQLFDAIENKAEIKFVIDAQFQQEHSPLKEWCDYHAVLYLHGKYWWAKQAWYQTQLWLPELVYQDFVRDLMELIPGSKSETIRALAIASIRRNKTIIEQAALCEDTENFRCVVEALGVKVEKEKLTWLVEAPAKLQYNDAVVNVGESATGLRILMALASVVHGRPIRVEAEGSLRRRPHADFLQQLNVKWDQHWPLKIPVQNDLPEIVSTKQSSQLGSGCMIAACAKKQNFVLTDVQSSRPYLNLTLAMLKDAGFQVELEENNFCVSAEDTSDEIWELEIQKDASACAFIEVILRKLNLPRLDKFLHVQVEKKRQGDFVFFQLFDEMEQKTQLRIDASDFPDLVPPLWSAAILNRIDLEIVNTPNLKLKECDRIETLVRAANCLGLKSEAKADGFILQAKQGLQFTHEIMLQTQSDHRMAMAFGLIQFFYPMIQVDDSYCVSKSFPSFWQALKRIKSVVP